jgi:ankyrin repeat protein
MPTGDSALHFSIRNKDTTTSLLIIDRMINIEAARNKLTSFNPFHEAALFGDIEAL